VLPAAVNGGMIIGGLVAAAVGVLAVSVFFLIRLDLVWGGLLERIAIWPVLLALPVLAWHSRTLPR